MVEFKTVILLAALTFVFMASNPITINSKLRKNLTKYKFENKDVFNGEASKSSNTDSPNDSSKNGPMDITTDDPIDPTNDGPTDPAKKGPMDIITNDPIDATRIDPTYPTSNGPMDTTTNYLTETTTNNPTDKTTDVPTNTTKDSPTDNTTTDFHTESPISSTISTMTGSSYVYYSIVVAICSFIIFVLLLCGGFNGFPFESLLILIVLLLINIKHILQLL